MFKTYINFFLVFCFSFNTSFSQNNLVTVIASGEGSTESSATNRALRNAIEKTFGVFISSSSQVSNDELIKDEIATVSSGNIADYEVIAVSKSSEMYNVSVSARISPERVVLNFKSAGKSVELKGSVYAQNVIKEKFYKEQELIAIKDFIKIYKEFWIIDSFSTHPCSPFFKKFGDEVYATDVQQWINYTGGISNYKDDFNKCRCYEGFMMDFKGNPSFDRSLLYRIDKYDRQERTFYHCAPIGFKENGSLDYNMGHAKNGSSYFVENTLNKNSTDISGEFHFLPVIYKAYYNSANATVVANAVTKLIMAISIVDKEAYKEKMGQFFNLTLITAIDEKIKVGSYSTIKRGDDLVKIPYYETTVKSKSNTYYLRNKESLELLKDFFDQQFYRSNPVALKVKNFSDFSKKIHFILSHKYLKDYADPFGQEYLYQPRSEFTLDLTPCIPFDYEPEYNRNMEYHRALYPSILLFRFSLSDLEKIDNIDFDWK